MEISIQVSIYEPEGKQDIVDLLRQNGFSNFITWNVDQNYKNNELINVTTLGNKNLQYMPIRQSTSAPALLNKEINIKCDKTGVDMLLNFLALLGL